MTTRHPSATAYLLAAALGAACGAGLRTTQEVAGSSPMVLVLGLGAGFAGVAAGGLLPDLPRGGRLGLAIVGAAAMTFAPSLAVAGLVSAALIAGIAFGAATRAPHPPVALGLGAVGAGLAFVSPVPALVAAVCLVAWADLRRLVAPTEPASLARSAPGVLAAAAGAWILGGSWAAIRGALDPTAAGFALALMSTCVIAAVVSLIPFLAKPWSVGASIGAAALGSLLALGALPHRLTLHLLPHAGTEDPRALLALFVVTALAPAALALGVGARQIAPRHHALGWLAVAVALVAGVHSGPDYRDQALICILIAGLVQVLLATSWLAKALGPTMWAAAAAVVLAPLPWPESVLPHSRAYILRTAEAPDQEARVRGSVDLGATGWGPQGAVAVEHRDGALSRLALDGFVHTPGSRADRAARMAGHLAPALSRSSDTAIVIGEVLPGASASLVTQQIGSVLVAVPEPEALRAIRDVAPERTEPMLHPSVRLVAGTPEIVLRGAEPADVVVEVASTPWADAAQGVPSRRQLELRRDRVNEDGVYVLVLPLSWMTEAELRSLLADASDVFADTRLFRAPDGADQALLACRRNNAAVPWSRLVQAAALGHDELDSLGVRAAIDLADRSLVGGAALAEFGAPGARANWRLGTVLGSRPRLLLPLFEPAVEGGAWLRDADDVTLRSLEARGEANKCLLRVLDDTAQGDFPSAFAGGKCLDSRDLDPLIAPHLIAATSAYDRAMAEGSSSGGWQECIEHTQAALLLHPGSADAHALAGRCRLVQDTRRATEDFESALDLDATHLDALLGMAQAQTRSGAMAEAELTLQAAARYHNANWRPHYHLGAFLLQTGRYDEAEDELSRARGMAGDESGLPSGALAHLLLLQERPNDALFHAQRAVELAPSAKHLDLVGWAYLGVRQFNAAQNSFQKAILADPQWWSAHLGLGRTQLFQRDWSGAARSFQQVLELNPGNPDAVAGLQESKALAELDER